MKKPIIIISAYSVNGRVIGAKNRLPFRLRTDLINFMKTTENHIVISGSKSYESIPDKQRPLKNRFNIVVSRNPDYYPSQANNQTMLCRSLEEAVRVAQAMEYGEKIFIIGGGEIYAQALKSTAFNIDEIIATEVYGNDIVGDTYFPYIDPSQWTRTVLREVTASEEAQDSHSFAILSMKPILQAA